VEYPFKFDMEPNGSHVLIDVLTRIA